MYIGYLRLNAVPCVITWYVCVGEYRDRIMVRHTELRLYTSALHHFQGFQVKVRVCMLVCGPVVVMRCSVAGV